MDVEELVSIARGPIQSVKMSLAIASAVGLFLCAWEPWRIRLFMGWSLAEYIGGQMGVQRERGKLLQIFCHLCTLQGAMVLLGTTPNNLLATFVFLGYTFLSTFYLLLAFTVFATLDNWYLVEREHHLNN